MSPFITIRNIRFHFLNFYSKFSGWSGNHRLGIPWFAILRSFVVFFCCLFSFLLKHSLHSISLLFFLLSVCYTWMSCYRRKVYSEQRRRTAEQMLFGVAFSLFLMKIEFEPARYGHVIKRANLCKRSESAVSGKQHH